MATKKEYRVYNGGDPFTVIDENGNFAPNNVFGNNWYVDNVGGSSTNNGKSVTTALDTIAATVALASAGDTIHVKGTATDYDESVVCTLDNITFIGHGFGVETGGWNADADATILTLSGAKGATVTGFLLRPDGATTGCAINISETVVNDSDAITIYNNIFKSTGTTAKYGILANGVPGYIKIYNNHFTSLDESISATSAPNTSGYGWEIVDNYFSHAVTKGIYMPLRRSLIKGNHFSDMTTCIDTVGYSATNGDYNDVNGNYIFETATWASVTNAQTNDSWQNNFHNFLPNVTIGGS